MTIYRGPGGGGNADSDAEINALTALTNEALAYSEAAGLEADAAAASAAAASTSASSAATSASGASTSASSASTSASSASTSATNAAASASSASTSASSASTSATNAASSASAASTSATNAAASETNAATSAASALTYATASAASAVTASTQASNAATSATAAAGSATTASTSATNAATSATNASNSASAASTSAANALASEVAAAASAASIDPSTLVRNNAAGAISVSSASTALRITQLGTGNALLVEDSTNPDASPFVIDTQGTTIIGHLGTIQTVANTGSAVTPRIQVVRSDLTQPSIGMYDWSTSGGISSNLIFSKSKSGTTGTSGVVASGDLFGALVFNGDDGTAFIRGASITANVDGTPGTSDMPGRLVFSTTADGASAPTERMRIRSDGGVGVGGVGGAAITLSLQKAITGNTVAYSARTIGVVQSDVTSTAVGYSSAVTTAATAFTLSNLSQFRADQPTLGAGSAVTNQYGFFSSSSLTGATNNYSFYGELAAGTGRYNFYAAGTADNYFAGNVGIGTTAPLVKLAINSTDAMLIPKGTTAQRPTGAIGYFRYNTDLSKAELYNGTAWGSVGGGATGAGGDAVFQENDQSVTTSYTISTNKNASSVGPITVASGVVVTVPTGSRWVVL